MTPSTRRTDLSNRVYAQTRRFYSEDGLWYFKTREGTDVGPFRYLSEAQSMLARFLADVQGAESQRRMSASAKPHFRTPAITGDQLPGSSRRRQMS